MDTTKIKKKIAGAAVIQKSGDYYKQHKRWLPLVSFIAGFSWDNLTLNRIDRFSDNMIMLLYILLLGSLIVLNHLVDSGRINYEQISKRRDLFPAGIQFFFGSLFSSYVVFYFQSASFSENWLFLVFLVILLVINEFIKDRYDNLRLNMSLYFMAAFSFSIFFVPVVLKIMNTLVFLVSGFTALIFIITILYFLCKEDSVLDAALFKKTGMLIGGLFVFLNLLYFFNWIPPVPLSLKEGGIYHHVKKQGDLYKMKFEKGSWYEFSKDSDDDFHFSSGDTVFCFASVFAPTKLEKDIFHHWQHYNEKTGEWQTTDRRSYLIKGGRDGGYRGYTYKRNLQPGEWRVNVETKEKLVLGRIYFELINRTKTDKASLFVTIFK